MNDSGISAGQTEERKSDYESSVQDQIASRPFVPPLTLLVAASPIAMIAATFVYEASYLATFGLPTLLPEPTIGQIASFGGALLWLAFVLQSVYAAIPKAFEALYDHNRDRMTKCVALVAGAVFVILVELIAHAVDISKGRFALDKFSVVPLIVYFTCALGIVLAGRGDAEQKLGIKIFMINRHLVVGLLITFMLASVSARGLTGGDRFVVGYIEDRHVAIIRTYGENAIAVDYDEQKQELLDSFTITPTTDISHLTLTNIPDAAFKRNQLIMNARNR